jgi:rhamnogalacturonyl hydrolase YesR
MLSQPLIEKVLTQAQSTASHSWEYGTVFEALLEYLYPEHSIFHTPFATGGQIPSLDAEENDALRYVKPFIRTDGSRLCEGNGMLFYIRLICYRLYSSENPCIGSSSDPASLGIPALLLSKTHAGYFEAATRQLNDLLHNVPRHPNGAISHREAEASMWADFIYMVPPFFAYYGVFTGDSSLVREAVRQCELYRELLGTEKGVWKHIINAERTDPNLKTDPGLWSTSNAWAAAGMARVLATMQKSKFAAEIKVQQESVLRMIKEIVDGAIALDTDSTGLLRNYLDDESWFGEVAGTALLAATAFRAAVLDPQSFGTKYTDWALRKLDVVGRFVDVETGIAAPVVNSLREGQRTPLDGVNPEGQAFVVLLYAAWRDWKINIDRGTS